MSDDLVECVALRDKAVLRYQLNKHAYRDVVAAAIAVALEEAAKMAESFTTPPIASDFGTVIVDQGGEIAAAIRAMIPQEPA